MIRTLPAGYNAGDTIYCYFSSFAGSTGASVTITGLAVTDVEVYKNGSVTQRSSDNGYTLLDTDGIDFDGSTGLQGFKVDTSDNSDSGFWADGSHYLIWVDAITVDSQTVRLGFEVVLGNLLRPTTAGRKLDVTATGAGGIDWGNVENQSTAVSLTGTTIDEATNCPNAEVTFIGTNVIDSNALAASAASEIQSGLATAAALATAQADLDTITGSDGVTLATAQGNYAPLKPTTAGRTLDVTAGGCTGIDWGNLENAGSTVNLAATTIGVIGNGGIQETSFANGCITDQKILDGAFTAAKFAASSLNGKGDWNIGKTGYTLTPISGLGNQTANITGSITNVTGGINTAAGTIQTLDQLDTAQDTQHATTRTQGGPGPWGDASGAGSGARTVTLTVDDGTDPLESARVRLTKGAETYIQTTDVDGEVSFSLDDGTWVVAITLAGYSFTPTTLVVNGDETVTYSMIEVAIAPPANPAAISAVYMLVDGGLANESGVTIYWRMIAPDDGAGIGFEQVWNESVTNGSGIATFAVIPGAGYEFAIAALTGCKFRYVIPDDAVNGHLISPKTVWQQ